MKWGTTKRVNSAHLSQFVIQSAKKICTIVENHVMKEQMASKNICQEGLKSVHLSTLSPPHWWQKERQDSILSTLIYNYLWTSMLILPHQEGGIIVYPDEH